MHPLLRLSPEVADALAERHPVVALETSILAHGLPWPENLETARRLDARTSAAVESLRGQRITHTDACGAVPVRGLLQVARRRRLRGRVLDLRNSGDTGGPRDHVVGYGAFAFE